MDTDRRMPPSSRTPGGGGSSKARMSHAGREAERGREASSPGKRRFTALWARGLWRPSVRDVPILFSYERVFGAFLVLKEPRMPPVSPVFCFSDEGSRTEEPKVKGDR